MLVAPLIPGISDSDAQVHQVVDACAEAGAVSIGGVPLHLRPGVRQHFMKWLERERPDLVPSYRRRYRTSYLAAPEQHVTIAKVTDRLSGRAGHHEDG